MITFRKLLWAAASLAAFSPLPAFACACGCGVFDVGTASMLPDGEGGSVWLEYDFMNQAQNWHGTSGAPKANNDDKVIRTDFVTAGFQYMFNRDWGVQANIPYANRTFKTTTDDPNPGDTNAFHHGSLGDVRVKGVYTGFSDDMTTGITFGLKLPTGDFQTPGFDRDTAIGSGSTDLLLGAFHRGALNEGRDFDWFVNGQWDQAFLTQQNYRPGDEVNAAIGSYYNDVDIGDHGKITPLLQLIGSVRQHDTGQNADAVNSGYQRLLVSPGVEYAVNQVNLYGDIEVPVVQNVNGNQLVAPVLFKFIVGYKF